MKQKNIRILLIALAMLCLLAALFFFKIIRLNGLFVEKDARRGVDVSAYQGKIDWDALAAQGVSFAYIKATEGSGTVDACFAANWTGARQAGIPAGAYHFFSFDSPAGTQAENFIAAVPNYDGALPPAVDVELYGAYKRHPKPCGEVLDELRAFSDALEAHYGVKPMLYVTRRSYALYVRGAGLENPLWVRDVYLPPVWAEDWLIWQYADRGEMAGYDGVERYIDLDVMREKGGLG